MAIENAPYVAGLNPAIPANTSPRGEGAAEIRAVKTALKNTFPNVDKPINANADKINQIFDNPSQVPIGLVAIWFEDTLPEGWVECDGAIYNGYQTTDMRGYFPRGKIATDVTGSTGGNDHPDLTEVIQVDGHALARNELPNVGIEYKDRYFVEEKDKLNREGAHNTTPNTSGNTVGSGDTDADNDTFLYVDDTTSPLGDGNAHKHTLSVPQNKQFDNRPAFINVRFICYVGVAP